MSTALAVQPEYSLPDNVLEGVVVGGDLSKLNATQRLAWYKARCEAAGLDPRTQPFQYLNLQGKLSLYATKAATDQLISNRKLTVEIRDRRHDRDMGIFEVHCRVSFADGHHVEDFAAVNVKGLQGEPFCNALMKGITKAKRRTVLSACGLGMLDESEIETIPNAVRVDLYQDTQSALPAPSGPAMASTKDAKRFSERVKSYCDAVNSRWLDRHTDADTGECMATELVNVFQLTNHMLKEAGVTFADGGKHNDRMRAAAALWLADDAGTLAGWKAYVARLAAEAKAEMAGPQPEDENQEAELVAVEATASREPGCDDDFEEGVNC